MKTLRIAAFALLATFCFSAAEAQMHHRRIVHRHHHHKVVIRHHHR